MGHRQYVAAGQILREQQPTRHALGDLVLGNIVMNKTFIDQHPQIVKEFVTASAKAADWATEHPDEARKMLGEILKKIIGNMKKTIPKNKIR